jgi:hypothetical protein
LGKEEWKYLPFIHPPHPSKHASTDNISSGLENSSDNIMETPLYNGAQDDGFKKGIAILVREIELCCSMCKTG